MHRQAFCRFFLTAGYHVTHVGSVIIWIGRQAELVRSEPADISKRYRRLCRSSATRSLAQISDTEQFLINCPSSSARDSNSTDQNAASAYSWEAFAILTVRQVFVKGIEVTFKSVENFSSYYFQVARDVLHVCFLFREFSTMCYTEISRLF